MTETILTAEQAEALYKAERDGIRQIVGKLREGQHSACALGAMDRLGVARWGLLDIRIPACPLCEATETWTWIGTHRLILPICNAEHLVVHLNNDHGMTFSEIARKLGPDAA